MPRKLYLFETARLKTVPLWNGFGSYHAGNLRHIVMLSKYNKAGRKRTRRFFASEFARRPIYALIWNIVPIACVSGATFALILAAFHICPFSVPVELFRLAACSGAAHHLLRGVRTIEKHD